MCNSPSGLASTGPVVVGDIGGGGRHEQLALGETPNIAARLEGLAAPNTVVISPVTARLVRQTFVLEDLGASALKGVAEPMAVWRVLGRTLPARRRGDSQPGHRFWSDATKNSACCAAAGSRVRKGSGRWCS